MKSEARLTKEKEDEYSKHISEKEAVRQEKENDKMGDIQRLCFDLENVLTCPKADISSFFYYSKLNVYNLTAQPFHAKVSLTVKN